MRRLAIGLLMTVFMFCLACDDIVVGENPITIVGNIIYVFPLEDDSFYVGFGRYRCDCVTVDREYEDYSVTFKEYIDYDINRVVVTLPSGNVYPIEMVRIRDDDDVYYNVEFSDLKW